MQVRNRDIGVENGPVDTGGGEGINWEIGIYIYTLYV